MCVFRSDFIMLAVILVPYFDVVEKISLVISLVMWVNLLNHEAVSLVEFSTLYKFT